MADDKGGFYLTISDTSREWLQDQYGDQLNEQERVRAAITDARRFVVLMDKIEEITADIDIDVDVDDLDDVEVTLLQQLARDALDDPDD